MRITIPKEKILDGVLITERITGKKETLPVLSCVFIEVGKGLSLRATNLEAGVEVDMPSEVGEKGVVAVPANVLSQTLRSIGSDKVTLKTEEGNLIVESRGTRTPIKAVPHEEFPVLAGASSRK